MKTVALTLLAVVLVLLLGFVAFVYSGLYDVAATEPHTALGHWALSTLTRRSIAAHAGDEAVPSLADTALLADGFHHFDAMCVTCHGAPGVERSEIGEGLYPRAPSLSEAAKDWSPAELYWILDHGIKMTGMPAFGEIHDEHALWAMVAFTRQLPALTPSDYAALRARLGGEGEHGEGEHGHDEPGTAEGEPPHSDEHTHTHSP